MTEPEGKLVTAGPVAVLWTSLLAAGALGFVAEVLFARHLSVSEYGSLATALAAIMLASPLAGASVGQFLLSRYGEEGATARRWLLPALRTAITAMALSGAALASWAALADLGVLERNLLFILLPTLVFFALAETAHGIFQLERRYTSLAVLQVGPYLGRLAVAGAAMVAGLTVVGIGVGLLFVGLILAIAVGLAMRRPVRHGFFLDRKEHPVRDHLQPSREKTATPAAGVGPATVLAVANGTWPYAVSGLLLLAHTRADVILLGWLLDPAEAGLLQVSLSVMAVVYYLPLAVYRKYLLPYYHEWAPRNLSALNRLHTRWTRRMSLIGFGAGVLVAGSAPLFVPRLFGSEFNAAVPLLALLAIWVPLRFASAGPETLLSTRAWIRRRVRIQLLSGTGHVILTVALIPLLGVYSAVVSTIFSELLLLLLYRRLSHRVLKVVAS